MKSRLGVAANESRIPIEPLHEKFERLRDMAPWKGTTTLPKQGVYLFSENGEHLYIGRSNNIPAQKFLDLFPGIQGMTRAQQKRGVAACIERYSDDAGLLAHPNTEPLVIDP